VSSSSRVASSIDEVVALYERWGHDHYDEEISQLDHALQTAAQAQRDHAGDDLIVAALLHDVGHLLELDGGDGRPDRHEREGANYLASVFPPSVTGPIALHVRAKRYRCAVDPPYHDTLSEGSRASLRVQGGPLDAPATAAFERNPGFEAAVALRGWDDGGKVEGLVVAPLADHVARLERVRLS
jgi:predicted HD phosphohydrolase